MLQRQAKSVNNTTAGAPNPLISLRLTGTPTTTTSRRTTEMPSGCGVHSRTTRDPSHHPRAGPRRAHRVPQLLVLSCHYLLPPLLLPSALHLPSLHLPSLPYTLLTLAFFLQPSLLRQFLLQFFPNVVCLCPLLLFHCQDTRAGFLSLPVLRKDRSFRPPCILPLSPRLSRQDLPRGSLSRPLWFLRFPTRLSRL
jgi:hypothetical protein